MTIHILSPSQNINKRESTKVNIYGINFTPNALTFNLLLTSFYLYFETEECNIEQ
jgi:hypothetical protein